MDKTYDPESIEQEWNRRWEEEGYFAPTGEGDPYCIMIPPPNVTGTLHMGHAFGCTIQDALIRYHRMLGYNTLWQPGTDHAGIATQMVVERQLNAEQVSRHDLGREAFLERVWRWREESGGTITRQLRRLGASVDWPNERFTMDDGLSEAVRECFVRLYDDGLIYRGKRLVNWDPVLQTAVSDLEVESEEEDGTLWHLRYPRTDGEGYVVVATTRPETMLGDTAVAVHPDDERYRDLIGKTLELPLCDRQIPVIADDYVDPDFGSGCVKITPAHDFNDYQVGARHELEAINIFNEDATISDRAPEAFRGLDRFDARRAVVDAFERQGLLELAEKHRLKVPRGDRTGAVIEPLLTDQWFVKAEPLARPSIQAVRDGRIKFVPENWAKTYFDWLENIEDWCISRQLWWGHRIPAWYDQNGNIYVAHSEDEARRKYKLADDVELEQDDDVLDTWFSSALWPFSTLGWPEKTDRLDTFYPGSVLVTGFDIIFFWVARMVMMGMRFMGDVPFKVVYIHGLIRDGEGNKMSKSKGNTLDPLDLTDGIELDELIRKRTTGLMQPGLATKIEQSTRKEFPRGIAGFGTDALRFTLCSLASLSRDINFDLGRLEGYRDFCNKLWNAARFVLQNTEGQNCGQNGEDYELGVADKWIISRLQQTKREMASAFASYRFDLAAQAYYDFTWKEYCAWYLEISKVTLRDDNAAEPRRVGTRRTLVRVLEESLRMAHPLIPFITEAIWQRVHPLAGVHGKSIMLQPYPRSGSLGADASAEDAASVAEMEWVQQVVLAVRSIRGEMNIKPSARVPLLLRNAQTHEIERLTRHSDVLTALARAESIDPLPIDQVAPQAASALVGELEILLPLAGLIDLAAERARKQKEIERLGKELKKSESKLSNTSFTARAPKEVVAKERERIAETRSALNRLEAQLQSLG